MIVGDLTEVDMMGVRVGGGGFNVSISCSEFSGGRGAVLLRQLCLRDDCYSFWFSI